MPTLENTAKQKKENHLESCLLKQTISNISEHSLTYF